jgi:hypothetical protein
MKNYTISSYRGLQSCNCRLLRLEIIWIFLEPRVHTRSMISLRTWSVVMSLHRFKAWSKKLIICGFFYKSVLYIVGRAIAQAVSRRLPTAAARVRAQVRSCGICGGQSGTGTGFRRVLPFPLPVLIPPTAPHSSSIIRSWYNRSVSGRRTKWTQSHPTKKKYTKCKRLVPC